MRALRWWIQHGRCISYGSMRRSVKMIIWAPRIEHWKSIVIRYLIKLIVKYIQHMAHPNSSREGTQYMYIKQEAIWLWLNCCSTSNHWAVHMPSQHLPSQHTTFTHHLTTACLSIESLHHLHIHQYTKWLWQYRLYALRCDISYRPLELSLKHLQTLTPIRRFPMDILHSVLNEMAIP